MYKITMTPPVGSGFPVRTTTGNGTELTLVGIPYSEYLVTLEVDGVVRSTFGMTVDSDAIRNIELLEEEENG